LGVIAVAEVAAAEVAVTVAGAEVAGVALAGAAVAGVAVVAGGCRAATRLRGLEVELAPTFGCEREAGPAAASACLLACFVRFPCFEREAAARRAASSLRCLAAFSLARTATCRARARGAREPPAGGGTVVPRAIARVPRSVAELSATEVPEIWPFSTAS